MILDTQKYCETQFVSEIQVSCLFSFLNSGVLGENFGKTNF